MKFKLDINLDDGQEAREFVAKYGKLHTRSAVARALGLKGKLAYALNQYAFYKVRAMALWLKYSVTALDYEGICDNIYSKGIQPVCECW